MHPDEVYEQVLSDQFDLGLISFANPRRELNVIPGKTSPWCRVLARAPFRAGFEAMRPGIRPARPLGRSLRHVRPRAAGPSGNRSFPSSTR